MDSTADAFWSCKCLSCRIKRMDIVNAVQDSERRAARQLEDRRIAIVGFDGEIRSVRAYAVREASHEQ